MLGLKNQFERLGSKMKIKSTFGKKAGIGRKVHDAFNIGNDVIQAFKPLEKVPIIGTGVKVITASSDTVNNLNNLIYDKSRKPNRGVAGNPLEWATVMPPEEGDNKFFV